MLNVALSISCEATSTLAILHLTLYEQREEKTGGLLPKFYMGGGVLTFVSSPDKCITSVANHHRGVVFEILSL